LLGNSHAFLMSGTNYIASTLCGLLNDLGCLAALSACSDYFHPLPLLPGALVIWAAE
jgi:hypothetical protein